MELDGCSSFRLQTCDTYGVGEIYIKRVYAIVSKVNGTKRQLHRS
jgi:hypothetical protein